MKAAGIVLLIGGLLLTIFTSFSFFTKKEVVDLGPINITKDEPLHFNWSPIAGIAVMGIGAVMLWQSGKKN